MQNKVKEDDFPFPVKLDYIVVWDGDLEDYIERIYGRRIEMQQVWECYQDSYRILEVDKDGAEHWWFYDPPDYKGPDYDFTPEIGESLVKDWQENGSQIHPELVMWHLAYTNKIPEGNYLIQIWW